ncbi:MAG: class I SAM-dependent rRNA methyltransferase [Thermodesulfobacteriota bacterium]
MPGQVRLKAKAERAARRYHPWLYSGAVDRVEGKPRPGDLVAVTDAQGDFIAWGHYSTSNIRVRLLDWNQEARIDETWWSNRLAEAVKRRAHLARRPGLNAYRVVFAESDGLPGLIADYYHGWIVLQALTPGVDRLKSFLAERLLTALPAEGVFERSDADSRGLEGLESKQGPLLGSTPPDLIEIEEHGFRFLVNPAQGQKTGFYLDQRPNRRLLLDLAADKDVLDCFSYTASFSVYAYAAGAKSVVRIESSADASELGRANLELNGYGRAPGQTLVADAFRVLREFRDRDRSFDLIVLDPPKLAPTRAQVSKAARAYKDINLLALKLLRPDGLLVTCSCSSGVDADLFQKIVFGASLDAGRRVRIIGRLSQGSDHPALLSFPEAAYLKGLIGRVV